MGRRLKVLVGSAVALALGSLVGGVLAEPSTHVVQPAAPRALADRALGGVAGGVSPGAIASLEEQARVAPGDATVLVQLGLAYQLRWRETADASFLPRSETALRRALRIRPSEPNAVLGLGSLALIRHEFRDALRLGRRAAGLLAGSARPYGVIGDALLELGRYDEAFAAFERMVALRPGLASYARIAYARELVGDRAGAVQAMELALDAAGGQPEPTAWALVELAKLERGLGRLGAAESRLRTARRHLAGYPAAGTELARVLAARGRLDRAIIEARRSTETVPTAASISLLAELLDRAGRPRDAAAQRAAIAVIDRLLAQGGIAVDLESAVYRADNRIRPLGTVALARRARADRPSIHGDDALAWALARAGRCREALPFAERALRLGTQDPLLFFHRGYAEGCAGNRDAMKLWYERALALDPAFSVRWAPLVRTTLRS